MSIEQEARAEAVRTQKAVWAEVHGQEPSRTYTVAEVKRLVYTLDNAISALVSRPASPATSEADECSCRGEYITALDLVDGCKCGRLKPFHEMTDEEVNVAASPATRETVTEEMVERGARAYWRKSMDKVGDRSDDWDESEREWYMWAARVVLEAAVTEKGDGS